MRSGLVTYGASRKSSLLNGVFCSASSFISAHSRWISANVANVSSVAPVSCM